MMSSLFFVRYLTSLDMETLQLKCKFLEELSTGFESILSTAKSGSNFVFCLRIMDDAILLAVSDFMLEKIK
jgi:nucleoside permease NupC